MGRHRKHRSRDESKERDRKRRKSNSSDSSSERDVQPKKHRSSHVDKPEEEKERRPRHSEEEGEHVVMTSYYGDIVDDVPGKSAHRSERDRDGDREGEKKRSRDTERHRERDAERSGSGEKTRDRDVEKSPDLDADKTRESDEEEGRVHEEGKDRDSGEEKTQEQEEEMPRDLDVEKPRDRDEEKPRGRDEEKPRGRDEEKPRDRDAEKPRDRDAEKHRDRDTEKPRERDSERHRERDSERHRERDSERHRERDSERHREREVEKPRDRDAERHRERDGEKSRDRGAERHRERDSERHRGRDGERKDRDADRGRRREEDRDREGDRDRDRNGDRNRERNGHRGRDRDGDRNRGRDDRDRIDGRDDRKKDRSRREAASDSKPGQEKEAEEQKPKAPEQVRQPTLGAYIPPAKLRMMQNAIQDKASATYQRLAWEALKKSINGLINKVNISNISVIVRELFKENLIRGRGILCRAIIQAQTASPTYTNVFAALVAIINTKFPNIGELLLKRLILQFRRGYKRNDKQACLSAVKFIAHLVNQQVAHEVLALELLTLLLEHPTAHSIEVAIAFLKEVGARLDEVSPKGAHAIFESLRKLLHEGLVEKRVQYMIEVMFQLRKDKYDKFPAVVEELDLVEEEDQFTHMITLDEEIDTQDTLNVFKMDEEYVVNEEKYAALRKEILDESEEESGDEDDEEEESDEEKANEEKAADGTVEIFDKTETNLLALRRTIYLTIQSSLDYEECCHKLMKANLPEGQESELCHMILDCCAQQRTYEKFFGLLAQRFCSINVKYVAPFEEIFKNTYDTVHRLDTNKLRNVAKFFAHLLFTDAISWTILEHIRLTEDDTTSSSRIFVKILCQELSEYMGLVKLNERFNDKTLKMYFEGLFPRDNPKNTRFSINFFTSIGLGGLTDELREHLKPKARPEP